MEIAPLPLPCFFPTGAAASAMPVEDGVFEAALAALLDAVSAPAAGAQGPVGAAVPTHDLEPVFPQQEGPPDPAVPPPGDPTGADIRLPSAWNRGSVPVLPRTVDPAAKPEIPRRGDHERPVRESLSGASGTDRPVPPAPRGLPTMPPGLEAMVAAGGAESLPPGLEAMVAAGGAESLPPGLQRDFVPIPASNPGWQGAAVRGELAADRAGTRGPAVPNPENPIPAPPEEQSADGAPPGKTGETFPAAVRARAEGEFRSRAERLWSVWLRDRAHPVSERESSTPGNAETRVPAMAAEEPLARGRPPAAVHPLQTEVAADGPEPSEIRELTAPAGSPRAGNEHPAVVERGAETVPKGDAQWAQLRQPASPAGQVAESVRFCLAKGGERVTVQLEPESLGRVQVELSRETGGVTAHFRVESPQTQQALSGELVVLRQALEEKGVPLVQVYVELDDGAGRERGAREQRGDRRRNGAAGAGPENPEEIAVRPPPWRPWGFEARI